MENIETADLSVITGLIEKLSELNEILSTDPVEEMMKNMMLSRISFIFGPDAEEDAAFEGYRRYYSMVDDITDSLNTFGIHIGNNGYSFLIDAVKIMIEKGDHNIRMKSDIYPQIAAKFRLNNPRIVEHSIRNALNVAYSDYLRNPACNNMGVFSKKPTPKSFVRYIADMVIINRFAAIEKSAG